MIKVTLNELADFLDISKRKVMSLKNEGLPILQKARTNGKASKKVFCTNKRQ